nr:hypothetical protein Iba_chr01cCG7130 [Ipomoea batatas]
MAVVADNRCFYNGDKEFAAAGGEFCYRGRESQKGRDGEEEGSCVRRWSSGRLRSREPVQGPSGDAGDEGAPGSGEVGTYREGQDPPREGPVVLPRRGRQPSPEVPPSCPPVSRRHPRRWLGQGPPPTFSPRCALPLSIFQSNKLGFFVVVLFVFFIDCDLIFVF